MAPESTVLKRQRSRPSEWWAASSSTTTQPAIHPPPAQPLKKAFPKPKISATGNSSTPAPAKKTIEKKAIEKASSQLRTASDTPQDRERASLKRKRARPSDWWAASPTVQSVEPPILLEGSRKASEKLGEDSSKPPAAIAEATSKNGTSKQSQSSHTEHQPNKTSMKPGAAVGPPITAPKDAESRTSKRKRARPSDWWAANPSTAVQEIESTGSIWRGAANAKQSDNQILKDVSSRGNLVKAVNRIEAAKGISKPKATRQTHTPVELEQEGVGIEVTKKKGKMGSSQPQQTGNKKATSKTKETNRGTPPRVLAQKVKKTLDQALPEDELAEPHVKDDKQLRRSRSSNTGQEVQAEIVTASVVEKPKGKGTQASKQNSSISIQDSARVEEGPKGRLRTRPSDARVEEPAPSANPTKTQSRVRRQHGSGEVLEVQTASSNFGSGHTKRHNRVEPVVENPKSKASKSVASGKASKIAKSQTSRAPSKYVSKSQSEKAARVSEINGHERKRKAEDKIVEPAHGAKRPRVSEVVQEEEEDEVELPKYQHLAEVTRNLNRVTIAKRWEGLPPGAVELISQLLNDTQRPVVVRIGDRNKQAQASTALQMIARRLLSKVSKGLPFPKGVSSQREDDFNFEKIIDRNRMLEGQLTAEVDANKLLEENLNQELSRLEAERAILTELEANAKTESALRKEAGRKMHPLLRLASSSEAEDLADSSSLGVRRVLPSLGVSTDEDLQTVVRDLEGHVESLQSNFKPLSGLPGAMAKAKAAVQITLFDHLESDRYEEVVLGPETTSSN